MPLGFFNDMRKIWIIIKEFSDKYGFVLIRAIGFVVMKFLINILKIPALITGLITGTIYELWNYELEKGADDGCSGNNMESV